MKRFRDRCFPLFVAALPILFCSFILADSGVKDAKPRITIKQIRTSEVIGECGVSLGEVFELEAMIAKHEGKDNYYFLQVTSANGKQLKNAVSMNFHGGRFSNGYLARDDFQLYELKYGKKPGSLDSNQTAELEKGYIGSKVKLIAYESGMFRGIPRNMPKDYPVWQDQGFHFSTLLSVLDRIDEKKAAPPVQAPVLKAIPLPKQY